jgi:5-methyltetrahydrofolate--homocysteine methyltransferase
MKFSETFLKKHLAFDGGLGTMLLSAGLPAGTSPDRWNIENPDAVRAVHAAYLAAGADMITANTFGSNAPRQKRGGYNPSELAAAGVRLAREAVEASGREAFVALDIGPLGEFLEPLGDLTQEEAAEYFREPIEAGAAAGADCVLIETMGALDEALCALRAAKTYGGGLPVLCTMTYDANGRIMTGEPLETVIAALEEAGADALGCNCGVGPEQLVPLLPRFTACAHQPLIMMPNAGLPEYRDGQTVYLCGPDAFEREMRKLANGGVWGLGGCCGTTPEHIALVSALAK